MKLTSDQLDRAAGVLVGVAVGDALGVPYEFQPASITSATNFVPKMIGGGLGPYDPGEWSDDTQMTMCIAKALSGGADPLTTLGLDWIALNFADWIRSGATDVGGQTRYVLERTNTMIDRNSGRHASLAMKRAAISAHQRLGKSGGNGSLMRTAPVALRYLDDPEKMAAAAIAISKLTHFDDLAADACVIWCTLIRHAVLTGNLLTIVDLIKVIPPDRRQFWRKKLIQAIHANPAKFSPNGYVVTALQATWAAVTLAVWAAETSEETFRDGIIRAVSAGNDTDTVAAIAGAVLGGLCGLDAIDGQWKAAINGWPSKSNAATLIELAQSLTA